MNVIKEFFGFGDGYSRPAAGFLSWKHLTLVTSAMIIMVLLALYLGRTNRNKDIKIKNKVLMVSAIVIDSLEILRMILVVVRSGEISTIKIVLPFFLCSIQLITIPIAAFAKGRLKEAALDFVFIFGILGAVLGTYGAGQDYGTYPLISYDILHTTFTHTISGFCSLYIAFSGMISMKKKNIIFTNALVAIFCVISYVTNILVDYNYMFLMRGDGTPYDIFYNLVGGSPVFYPMVVVLLFFLYIVAFYFTYYFITERRAKAAVAPDAEIEKNFAQVK